MPFDALEEKRLVFDYKPAKTVRKKFSPFATSVEVLHEHELPEGMVNIYEQDVTAQYVKAYDIKIPLTKRTSNEGKYHYAVICVFDNKDWRIVHYGQVKDGAIVFNQMASDVAYLAGFYDNDKVIPASEPFLIRADGIVKICVIDTAQKKSIKLTRMYPMFAG